MKGEKSNKATNPMKLEEGDFSTKTIAQNSRLSQSCLNIPQLKEQVFSL
jgi:hypothetical protein